MYLLLGVMYKFLHSRTNPSIFNFGACNHRSRQENEVTNTYLHMYILGHLLFLLVFYNFFIYRTWRLSVRGYLATILFHANTSCCERANELSAKGSVTYDIVSYYRKSSVSKFVCNMAKKFIKILPFLLHIADIKIE
jgi:hypothetical protein